jgi:hypothetical protein
MNGSFAMLHDIVGWKAVSEDATTRYGLAVVVGIGVGREGQRVTHCRFWLPKSGKLGTVRVPVSNDEMARADLIGALPLWVEWDE